jgi:hypothetical protein
VRFPHGFQELFELPVHLAGEVPAAFGREHVHQPALDPALPALRGLQAVHRLVELSPPAVYEIGEPPYLRVVGGAPGPRLVPLGARRIVSVAGPHHRPLLPLLLLLRFA